MRDPSRIDKFCDELKDIWKSQCPDMRFGQFIINVFGNFKTDCWYWEENRMIFEIKEQFGLNKKIRRRKRKYER